VASHPSDRGADSDGRNFRRNLPPRRGEQARADEGGLRPFRRPLRENRMNAPDLVHPVYLDEKIREIHDSGRLEYRSKTLPTWCPGCGYFSIVDGLTSALRQLNIANENAVVVSGIG